ncbi:hypothetical protein AX17_007189 [Amanita inopinata Kibby_2008]|nr:hypothetical protein AX17_007189 [Amanita inopinata Kibby_2008]
MLKAITTTCVLTILFYRFLKAVYQVVRKRKIIEQTGLPDLAILGEPRKDGKKIKGTAVICGGSLAGLAAARICHDHFERIVIVESEAWLSTEDAWTENVNEQQNKRTRLMQWESLQGFHVWGTSCLKKLFPNFITECTTSEISLIPGNFKIAISGLEGKVPVQEYDGGLPMMVCAGRPGLETLLRRLVVGRKSYPNIEQVAGTVVGVEHDVEDPRYLNKVLVRQGTAGDDSNIIAIPAALVVDCTGPARAGSKMIRRLGFGTANTSEPGMLPWEELKISFDQDMHYSTLSLPVTDDMIKRFPAEAQKVGPILNYFPDSRLEHRVVFSQRVDRRIVQLCTGQWGNADLPTSLDDFKAFAKSLNADHPIPAWWYQFVDTLKDVEDKMTFKAVRIPSSVYTRYHLAANMPNNWVALGDSIMRINPIFGQGINKALLGVVSLNTLLHEVRIRDQGDGAKLPRDFARRFFDAQAGKIEPIWDGVKGVDYDFDTTIPLSGETRSAAWLIRWYIRAVQRLAASDEKAGSAVWHVQMFLAPPIDYFHPDLLIKVIWGTVTGQNP